MGAAKGQPNNGLQNTSNWGPCVDYCGLSKTGSGKDVKREVIVELELQEWLFLILGLLIVAVLVHGFWVQYFGSDRLPLKLDKRFVSAASESGDGKDVIDLKAELPNGGARVVKVGSSQIPVSDPARVRECQSAAKTSTDGSAGTASAASLEAGDEGAQMSESIADASMAEQPPSATSEMSSETTQQETLFLVLQVLGDLSGQSLLESLFEQGFEYGEKFIFHRLDNAGYPKISLANAVEPGIFDIASMNDLTTPGVTIFMCAHECEDAPAVFEELLLASAHLAEDLGAQLCDDRRSAVTEQTVAHLRQTVQEFQFRRARAL
jgi:cell division protein ZipA